MSLVISFNPGAVKAKLAAASVSQGAPMAKEMMANNRQTMKKTFIFCSVDVVLFLMISQIIDLE